MPRDDGSVQRIFRCPRCQVAVFSQYGQPEVSFVRAGTLDVQTEVTPDVHIFTRSKVHWVTLPEGTPAFEAYYDERELWPAESLRLRRARGERERRVASVQVGEVGDLVGREGAAPAELFGQRATVFPSHPAGSSAASSDTPANPTPSRAGLRDVLDDD